ncbi:MAG TPA: antibiotic acetyltransferase [Bacteroidota bacterium]|nr:antibiotic acetyltransferase [Bacteroidota bacterium]
MLLTRVKDSEIVHSFYRRLLMAYKRKRYGLKNVHRTFIMNGKSRISPDFVAHEYSSISYECSIGPRVELGPYAMLGPRVTIVGGDHAYRLPGTPIVFSGRPLLKKTVIEADAWVGYGVVVKAGVRIGRGAIVAAGSVVLTNVPPYEIYGGNPAKKIFDRFLHPEDREIHDQMLAKAPKQGTYLHRLE